MSRFAPHFAHARALQRLVAATIVTLMAAVGLTIASAPSASAFPVGTSTLIPTWNAVILTDDVNGNGRPDVGDTVGYSMRYSLTGPATEATVDEIVMRGETYNPGTVYVAGTDSGLWATRTVTPDLLDALGGGTHYPAGSVTYRIDGVSYTDVFPAPPVLYTAPTPISVSTSFAMTENYGSVPNQLVEGDQVHYVTTVTNTSAVDLTISGTGYASPALPLPLAAGTSIDLLGANVDVTYAHMVAGGIPFADASLGWAVGDMSGSVPVTVGTAPTEPIDTSVIAGLSTVVRTSGGDAVAFGDAVAGDHIDYTFQLQNTGNVVMNYVGFERAWSVSVDGLIGKWSIAANLAPGASLPSGDLTAAMLTSNEDFWPAYPLTQADIDRGFVDLNFENQSAWSNAVYDANPEAYTHPVSKRVYFRDFTSSASVTYTKAQFNDANGDGVGNEGETVTYGTVFENLSDQDLLIGSVDDLTDPHVSGRVPASFVGTTVARGDQVAEEWNYTITSADETRGTLTAGVRVSYVGQADWASKTSQDYAATISTGTYVAPATTLDTSATYADDNLDGFPSIGETVTFTTTVANTGAWDLTGLTVGDASGSDVHGLLPAFASTIAAGTSERQTFTHQLTAADFARGSLWYGTEMTATGVPTTQSGTSVTLTGITFQAYETDLDAVAEGGIDVCLPTGVATGTVTTLGTIWVKPGACGFVGAADGYRVVAFSTPLDLGIDTFAVKLPVTLHVGVHRLALYAPDGSLVGWKTVTVKDPIAGAGNLAATGADANEVRGQAGGAAALVLLGAATVFVSMRRKRSVEV